LLLAFSSLHRPPFGPTEVVSSSDFLDRAKNAGVSAVAFLRHGKTSPKPESGSDFDRVLTEDGRRQARDAGLSFGKDLKPFYHKILVSPAPRTKDTASIFLSSSGVAEDSVGLIPVQHLYDGTMQPGGPPLFQKIGYAPLRDYLEATGEQDRETSRRLLGSYAEGAVESIMNALDSPDEDQSTTLLVVGHAVYLPAAAFYVAALAKCDEASMDVLLSTNTREAEAYVINLEDATVKYLTRS
jgi:phosphohistidine phosphatase SixA